MYNIGDKVSYGLHGKCVITGIETKQLPSGPINFYQIRIIKNPISNNKISYRNGAAILVPVESAESKGLRSLMSKVQAEQALQLLAEPSDSFDLSETWISKQKKLEEIIRKEGAIGIAKVVGHLYTLIKQDAVPPTEVLRFYDAVSRVFTRELAEAFDTTVKNIDSILTKALRNRISFDQ